MKAAYLALLLLACGAGPDVKAAPDAGASTSIEGSDCTRTGSLRCVEGLQFMCSQFFYFNTLTGLKLSPDPSKSVWVQNGVPCQ